MRFELAGLLIEVLSPFDMEFSKELLMFKSNVNRTPDSILSYYFNVIDLDNLIKSTIMEENNTVSFCRTDQGYIYKYDELLGKYRAISTYNTNHSVGAIYLSTSPKHAEPIRSLSLLSTDQILLSRLLLKKEGFLLHGNCVVIDGNALLILGVSGSGKSTLSKILSEGAQIVSDDRVVITTNNRNLLIHGSWLHGSNKVVTRESSRLAGILVLEKAKTNSISSLPEVFKTEILLSSIIRPLFNSEEWTLLLGNVFKLLNLPFYKLSFNTNERGEQLKLIRDITWKKKY